MLGTIQKMINSTLLNSYNKSKVLKIEENLSLQMNDYLRDSNNGLIGNVLYFEREIHNVKTPYLLDVCELKDNFTGLKSYHVFLRRPRVANTNNYNLYTVSGRMFFREKRSEAGDKYLKIGDILINCYRGQGFSKDFLELVIKTAKTNKCKYITGNVTASDLVETTFLLSYYQRIGFNITDQNEFRTVIQMKI